MREGPRDECGVFGLYAPGHEVARLSYFALYALQHRGQESAGIAAADRGGHIITRRELGLVSQVFSENDLRTLAGELAIGHVRYSTTGSNAWENSQPVQRSEGTDGSRREVALAHNGNLINAVELHDELIERGVTFSSTSDSEIIAALIATHPAERVEDAIADVLGGVPKGDRLEPGPPSTPPPVSEITAAMIATPPAEHVEDAIADVLGGVRGD